RFLVVAVIGVAVAELKKNRLVLQLKKSVELRVYKRSLTISVSNCITAMKEPVVELLLRLTNLYNHHQPKMLLGALRSILWIVGSYTAKLSKGDEVLQYKMRLMNEEEQEERRMSDLSDWVSKGSSTIVTTQYQVSSKLP
ncbi:hypothetical protein Tsubulata_023009, partial [Turnera subulata]